MKVALGMVTLRLDSSSKVLEFIQNAERYGHKIESVIIACTKGFDEDLTSRLRARAPLTIIELRNPLHLEKQFRERGVSSAAFQTLLKLPFCNEKGIVPFGFNRNTVLMEAILQGLDTLIFIDSDVAPCVLSRNRGQYVFEEIDFFGRHLDHLKSGAQATSSEYSGYNVLPEACFDGMDDLLVGLQKDEMISWWADSMTHHCLTVHEPSLSPAPCTKILGGNAGFRLEAFSGLPPFFSSYYMADGEVFISRGEDTVLSRTIVKKGVKCTDIQTKIFHDTFYNYPKRPDLRGDPAVQRRFYYACTGWIGRNPFYNYILGSDLEEVRRHQRGRLLSGSRALYRYTSNDIYLSLPDKFDISWNSLDRYVREYEELIAAWAEFIAKCEVAKV